MKMNEDRCIEIESVEELVTHIESESSLDGVAIQGLDLSPSTIEKTLLSLPGRGAHFLGCTLSEKVESHIRSTGGTIFPDFKGLPFNAYRSSLYTVGELMKGYERGNRRSLEETVDGKIYAYFQNHRSKHRPIPIIPALSFRIHDHAVDNALFDLLYPKDAPPLKVLAVMGGHKMRRDDEFYLAVANIASRLAKMGYFVTSGGGPGAMEATNLGGYFCDKSQQKLEKIVGILSEQPFYRDELYIEKAYEVLDAHPRGSTSLAIPTWFYGHEPTNLFASHIAKYFANSLREDGMLAIAEHGVIFSPGSAGTIQEVFMDAAQNRYESYGVLSPMIFLGKKYWTETKPVYSLLRSLAHGCKYEPLLMISDDVDEIVDFIRDHPPILTGSAFAQPDSRMASADKSRSSSS
jgi:predicted Rossmann-fold nucleotide-binding protein